MTATGQSDQAVDLSGFCVVYEHQGTQETVKPKQPTQGLMPNGRPGAFADPP